MKKLVLLFLLIPSVVLSQKFSADRPDEMVKPDPFTAQYFGEHNNYKQVESIVTIAKNKYNNFIPDTLNIDYYNKNGSKIKTIRYDNNKVSTTTLFNYDATNKLLSWQTFERKSSSLTTYDYNKKGQMVSSHSFIISSQKNKTDTIEKSRMLFQYEADKLVQITNNSLGMDIIDKFYFKQNKLQQKTGGFISKTFTYNSNHQLNGITEYMGGTIDTTKVMGIETLAYNKEGMLAIDSVLTSSNLASKSYQVIEYSYTATGQLQTMYSKYKNFYRNVDFSYSNGKLQEVNLTTNGNSAFLAFIISFKIADYYSFPIKYKEQFLYDEYGNKVAKKVWVNDELFSEVNYVFTYTQ